MQPSSEVRLPLLTTLGIPDHSNLQPKDNTFWNMLEVRVERVIPQLHDVNYVARQLERLNTSFTRAILEWVGVEPEIWGLDALADIVCRRGDEVWVQSVFLLLEFCENRRYESFRTAARELLSDEYFALIDERFDHMQTNRLLLALRVFCEAPEKLKFLLLWDSVDARTYRRYSLVPVIPDANHDDTDNHPLTTSEIEQRIASGVELDQITEAIVNSILSDFETKSSSRRQSNCQGLLLTDEGESGWIFIKRQLKESYLTEVNRTVFADEAELIIIRFRNKMREIDIKFELKETIELAARIPAHFLDAPVEYIPTNETASDASIQRFLTVLLDESDNTLKLMEVDNVDLPLEGNPRLILRGDKATGIAQAIKHLEEHHALSLLSSLNNLNSIKLSYVSLVPTRRQNRASYIITVYLQQLSTDNRYFISYSTRAPLRDRTAFEEYMLSRYDIRIVPRTDD